MSDREREDRRRELTPVSAALAYAGVGAPRVIASGEGALARRIRALAAEHDVPIVEDDRLAALLCSIPLGDDIPESLYLAVAEVLAYVYRMEASLSERA